MSESDEEYSLLPVEQSAIHPLARIRFDYEVDELAESVRAMGQVQPGKAVRQGGPGGDKASYLVYIGCRRLVACKKASLKHFKAMVVGSIDEGRLQRELLTENVKRANLSVLEELNLLANYSRRLSSLEELARDLGLSQRLVRARVKLAILTQDKGLVETLYKIERISAYRFTHLHLEKLTALEEAKWLPVAVHAAERNWKAEEVETLGDRLSAESLLQTLPAWGRQFVPSAGQPSDSAETSAKIVSDAVQASAEVDRPSQPGSTKEDVGAGGDDRARSGTDSPSRYQTVARSAQFLICPKCGSESVIEVPPNQDITLLRPGRAEGGLTAIPLGKETIPLSLGFAFLTCTNESCGRAMIVALDQSGDGVKLAGKEELQSLMGRGIEPEDGGWGALLWDEKEELWLKYQSKGGDSTYRAYDEQSRTWVIPVEMGKRTLRAVD